MADVFTRIAVRLREVAAEEAEAVAPAPTLWRVTGVSPLTLAEVHGDGVIEESDPDVEVVRPTGATPPTAGDLLVVHQDTHGDYLVTLSSAAAPGGGGPSFAHIQTDASGEWIINHGLGVFPSVTTVEGLAEPFEVVEGEVDYIDANTVRVRFSVPISGRAYLN